MQDRTGRSPERALAAGLLVLFCAAVLGLLIHRSVTKSRGTSAAAGGVPAAGLSAGDAPPLLPPGPGSERTEPDAAAAVTDGRRFAEQLFVRGLLFSELKPALAAQTYPDVYGKLNGDPRYAAAFLEGARAGEDELVRDALGTPPVVDADAGPVLSAQVAGPVGRAIRQGLNDPGSYQHEARDFSRPRPYYFQRQWCWKVDKFWYRSRSPIGGEVRDCVAAVVAKANPYDEFKVVALQEAKF